MLESLVPIVTQRINEQDQYDVEGKSRHVHHGDTRTWLSQKNKEFYGNHRHAMIYGCIRSDSMPRRTEGPSNCSCVGPNPKRIASP